jgi:hypothetical protein
MQVDHLENLCLDFVVNREQTNAKGEKMSIQTHMVKYAKEFWKLLHHILFNFLFQLELLGIFAPLYTEYLHICISRSCHRFVVVCSCLFQLAFMGIIAFMYTKYLLCICK